MDDDAIRQDYDALLEPLLDFALHMLGEHGEFFPAGAAITDTGEVTLVGVESGDEEPEVKEVVDLLVSQLRDLASEGEIRASGIVVGAVVELEDSEQPSDAALVHLEHRDGEPLDVALPYEPHGDHVHPGELIAGTGASRVFDART